MTILVWLSTRSTIGRRRPIGLQEREKGGRQDLQLARRLVTQELQDLQLARRLVTQELQDLQLARRLVIPTWWMLGAGTTVPGSVRQSASTLAIPMIVSRTDLQPASAARWELQHANVAIQVDLRCGRVCHVRLACSWRDDCRAACVRTPGTPEGGNTPNITECQQYSFVTVVTQNWTVGVFTVKGELQQGYDSNFAAWCYYFRYKATVSSSSSPGGTLYVDVNSCGNKGYENTYSLPSGSFSNYYYSKVAPISPTASGWWRIYTGSSDYSQYGACGGNR